jgi:hypothetical protein
MPPSHTRSSECARKPSSRRPFRCLSFAASPPTPGSLGCGWFLCGPRPPTCSTTQPRMRTGRRSTRCGPIPCGTRQPSMPASPCTRGTTCPWTRCCRPIDWRVNSRRTSNSSPLRVQANIELESVTRTIDAGGTFVDHLRITNTGHVTWRARGRRFGGQVTCGLKVCTTSGEVLREDLGRTPLAADVHPGEMTAIAMYVHADLAPGLYELRYDMVVEGVTWFEFHGSTCPRRALEIR